MRCVRHARVGHGRVRGSTVWRGALVTRHVRRRVGSPGVGLGRQYVLRTAAALALPRIHRGALAGAADARRLGIAEDAFAGLVHVHDHGERRVRQVPQCASRDDAVAVVRGRGAPALVDGLAVERGHDLEAHLRAVVAAGHQHHGAQVPVDTRRALGRGRSALDRPELSGRERRGGHLGAGHIRLHRDLDLRGRAARAQEERGGQQCSSRTHRHRPLRSARAAPRPAPAGSGRRCRRTWT